MKKLLLFIVALVVGFTTMHASNDCIRETEVGKYYRGNKGNISSEDLPDPIIKYLEKNYTGYTIIVSKRKGNGYYFVKINFPGYGQRPYYRSLVFTSEGKVVKG